ncbi:nicotinate/nicotinamide nucleotide adenylyltransferase [Burkholderiales bacterium JOSHI_001]|nr:nicotinate/nicotinamide nucleotide adenylyltransferase [Burkholderiales bacterium JOSHI_001]
MPSGFAPLLGSSIGTTLGTRFVPRRVGLFGGSFNPPHRAHRALADLALGALRLDELRWLPAGAPWQKPQEHLAPAEHRAAMVALAAEGEPRFVVDDRELRRSGPSYTLDTVNELEREIPGALFFLIIGQDQYARLHTWHHWRELLPAVTLAVTARGGQTVRPSPAVGATWHRVEVLDLPAMDVSATRVREMAARGEDITTMVGEPVAGYIARHHLYSDRSSNGSDTP